MKFGIAFTDAFLGNLLWTTGGITPSEARCQVGHSRGRLAMFMSQKNRLHESCGDDSILTGGEFFSMKKRAMLVYRRSFLCFTPSYGIFDYQRLCIVLERSLGRLCKLNGKCFVAVLVEHFKHLLLRLT